jgi:hypothetical protein
MNPNPESTSVVRETLAAIKAINVTLTSNVIGKHDPVLQELWAIKAQLNAEAGYSVHELVKRAVESEQQRKLAAQA